jgi:hypothetical protein
MKFPNAISIAGIVGLIALCQGLSETLPVLGQPWVPFAIVALGALVKGLQVYLEQAKSAGEIRGAVERKQNSVIRRTLLD